MLNHTHSLVLAVPPEHALNKLIHEHYLLGQDHIFHPVGKIVLKHIDLLHGLLPENMEKLSSTSNVCNSVVSELAHLVLGCVMTETQYSGGDLNIVRSA